MQSSEATEAVLRSAVQPRSHAKQQKRLNKSLHVTQKRCLTLRDRFLLALPLCLCVSVVIKVLDFRATCVSPDFVFRNCVYMFVAARTMIDTLLTYP
jgi:hypothetical protein